MILFRSWEQQLNGFIKAQWALQQELKRQNILLKKRQRTITLVLENVFMKHYALNHMPDPKRDWSILKHNNTNHSEVQSQSTYQSYHLQSDKNKGNHKRLQIPIPPNNPPPLTKGTMCLGKKPSALQNTYKLYTVIILSFLLTLSV